MFRAWPCLAALSLGVVGRCADLLPDSIVNGANLRPGLSLPVHYRAADLRLSHPNQLCDSEQSESRHRVDRRCAPRTYCAGDQFDPDRSSAAVIRRPISTSWRSRAPTNRRSHSIPGRRQREQRGLCDRLGPYSAKRVCQRNRSNSCPDRQSFATFAWRRTLPGRSYSICGVDSGSGRGRPDESAVAQRLARGNRKIVGSGRAGKHPRSKFAYAVCAARATFCRRYALNI
jgi:hypothetical protein